MHTKKERDKDRASVRVFIYDVNLKVNNENTAANKTFVDLYFVGMNWEKNSVPKSHPKSVPKSQLQ